MLPTVDSHVLCRLSKRVDVTVNKYLRIRFEKKNCIECTFSNILFEKNIFTNSKKV